MVVVVVPLFVLFSVVGLLLVMWLYLHSGLVYLSDTPHPVVI